MKTNIVLILFAFITLGVTSCKKANPEVKETVEKTSEIVIEEINNFKPEELQMGKIYQKFVAQKSLYANELKNSIPDQQIDSAKWNIETYLNSTYGFRSKDTCYKKDEVIDTVTFTIKGYNNSIPIVDGAELNTFLTSKESSFAKENSDGDYIDFWCNIINVIGISGGNVTVTMNIVSTIRYVGVYPPGYNPLNFPHYTCMQAIGYGSCDGKYWRGANNEYEYRYEYNDGSSWISNGYIMVYDYSFYKAFNSQGVNGRLWYIYGQNYGWHLMDTNPPDELNYYLQSTKNMIDDFNPYGIADRYLGNLDIWGSYQNLTYPYTTSHAVTFFIFKKVAVGLPG